MASRRNLAAPAPPSTRWGDTPLNERWARRCAWIDVLFVWRRALPELREEIQRLERLRV